MAPNAHASPESSRTIIIGAGPAGLTAAYELVSRGLRPLVLEASDQVGGLARTETYKGYRFDIGGHRFFTKVGEVEELWHKVLGDDFIRVPRLSRIYYRGQYFDYPLRLFSTLRKLGIYESLRILLSYFKWKVAPHEIEETFEHWVTNRFGRRLFLHFFEGYTEKVWGIPCSKIRADWAAQRIKDLSLIKAALNALTGRHDTSTLITEFDYPRLGPGMMWERFRDRVEEQGGEVRLQSPVRGLRHDGRRVQSVILGSGSHELPADHVISTMPLSSLVLQLEPAAPDAVREAARRLSYRDFLIVSLILDVPDPFPDNWVYIHSPGVRVARIQNFRSWSAEMVPEPDRTCVGLEYFCNEDDSVWSMDDGDLIDLAARELAELGLAKQSNVVDGTVIRQRKAYPVYDETYAEAVEIIQGYLAGFENLQTVGRNGMHRYNNQDHSMLTALLAARNVAGERHDPWNVNLERSYHEEFVTRSEP